jgi:hypothetical protein
MNGIETHKIKEFDPDIPVVMLSSQDKIDVAVVCTIKLLIMVKSETSFLRLQKTLLPSILKESKRNLIGIWPECNDLIDPTA